MIKLVVGKKYRYTLNKPEIVEFKYPTSSKWFGHGPVFVFENADKRLIYINEYYSKYLEELSDS